MRNFRERAGISQKELGKSLGVSGNYIYLIESGQKSPGPSLLKLFETLELSPFIQSEGLRESFGRARGPAPVGFFDDLGTETLKQNIADLAARLPGADPVSVLRLLENIREMMAVLADRLRPRSEISLKPPSEMQAAAKRASASAKTDPSE